MFKIQNVNDKVDYFSTITWLMIDKYFPLRPVAISSTDKEWMTPKVKELILKRQKAHLSGDYDVSKHLAKKLTKEIRRAKFNYHKTKVENILGSSPKEWYSHINKILGRKTNNINLSNIPELANKPVEEQVKIINAHFAEICKKYPPLNKNLKVNEGQNERELEEITELATYKLLKRFGKKSLAP